MVTLDICTDCTKRPHCSCLCPEADLYASQDWMYRKEKTIGTPVYGKYEWPEESKDDQFTPTEKKILELLAKGKSRKKIAKILDITPHSLEVHISNLKKKAQESS